MDVFRLRGKATLTKGDAAAMQKQREAREKAQVGALGAEPPVIRGKDPPRRFPLQQLGTFTPQIPSKSPFSASGNAKSFKLARHPRCFSPRGRKIPGKRVKEKPGLTLWKRSSALDLAVWLPTFSFFTVFVDLKSCMHMLSWKTLHSQEGVPEGSSARCSRI